MSFKAMIAKETGINSKKIPSGYQVIGDIMLLKIPGLAGDEKKKIADAVIKLFPNIRSVCESSGIEGELREPNIKLIAGERTTTIHRENNVLYHLDVSQVMFSKGNLLERKRLISQVKKDEVIIDMFAGIGYFSLGIAKFTKAGKIYALEKNAAALKFLRNNMKINKIDNIDAIFGDCRDMAETVENIADRIIMGYFPGTEVFLPAAIKLAKNNGILHFHNSYGENEIWKKPENQIADACRGICEYRILNRKKVKSIGPRRYHVVLDIIIKKSHKERYDIATGRASKGLNKF
jgi:tRNA wybutosine-synthesizing protein 2